MERITERMLGKKVDNLNHIAGWDTIPTYSTIGYYVLDYAYGGVALHKFINTRGGIRDIFNVGHVPKRELYNLINAYIAGKTT